MESSIQESEEINNMILTNKSINRVDYQVRDQLRDRVVAHGFAHVRDQVWDQLCSNLRK
jgi:hypothetical protein